MALTERLALLVSLDAQGAIRGFEQVGRSADKNLSKAESKLDRVSSRMQKAGAGMLGAAGIASVGLYKAGQAAADLEQAVGGTEAVFKDASGQIERFAEAAASNLGLSERAAREATTGLGGQLKGLGFELDEAADKSIELAKTAADLAATYGGTTAEAVQALGAALRGEADPAERFNLFLNQTRVNAKAVELGLAASTSQVDANAKAQATLALITEQSADAQGQFAREAGTAAGQMQIANAEFENAKASLGEAVAPLLADIAGGLAGVAGGFQTANDASGGFLSKLATFGTIGLGAAGGLTFVIGKLIDMRDTLAPLGGRLRTTEGALTRMGRATAAIPIAGLAVGIVQMGRELDGLKVSINNVNGAFADMDEATEGQTRQMLQIAEAAGGLEELIGGVADASVPAAERLLEFAEANGFAKDEMDSLRQVIEDKRDADVQGAEDQAAYSAEVEKATGAAGGLTEATGGLTDRMKEQQEVLHGLVDAINSSFDANVNYRRSVDDTEGAIRDLRVAFHEHGAESEDYRDALLDTEAALLDQADAAVRLAEEQAKANFVTLTAKDKAEIYKEELLKLRDTLKSKPLIAALDEYIAKLNSIPESISTSITYSRPTVNPDVRGGRAIGGPVSPHQTYLVGERGPELLTMGAAGGRIIPNLSTSSGTSLDQTVIINNPAPEPISKSARYLRRVALEAGAL